ncbi:unnamed protein product [Clavelina lepadiformis]|uniref:Uncharacterized protein n=1 Tax=Clavelina lepadiformis TaxID=159417 RepID=A0ABP0G623_CLALP
MSKSLLSDSIHWNGSASLTSSPAKSLTEYQPIMSKLSPRGMTSSALTTYHATSPITHQSWETALTDILSVLRIQYRNDDDVMLFLTDPDKIKQLQYSTAAKMEWNRRVIKEEMDSGIHSPPRSRRIAKEVAIDYIRRYLDGEEERMDMLRKIQVLQADKDDNLSMILDMERDVKRLKDENASQAAENAKLREEMSKIRSDGEIVRRDSVDVRNDSLKTRDENEQVRSENAKLRDENKKLRVENQDLRNENGALRTENQKVRTDNIKLRDEAGDMRNENMKVRGENQALRDENQELRCENLKLRDNNSSLRSENDRFRTTNETLLSENRKVVRENLELHAREDEMKMLVNVQQSLLAGKVGDRGEDAPADGQDDDEED